MLSSPRRWRRTRVRKAPDWGTAKIAGRNLGNSGQNNRKQGTDGDRAACSGSSYGLAPARRKTGADQAATALGAESQGHRTRYPQPIHDQPNGLLHECVIEPPPAEEIRGEREPNPAPLVCERLVSRTRRDRTLMRAKAAGTQRRRASNKRLASLNIWVRSIAIAA